MANIKEIKRLRGGDLQVAAQANVQIDAEIGQKDHFRMETILMTSVRRLDIYFRVSMGFQQKRRFQAGHTSVPRARRGTDVVIDAGGADRREGVSP